MRRLANAFVLLACVLALSACASLTKMAYSNAAFAYSNLGQMIAWAVDDYVDLQGAQKDWVRDRIAHVMHWHRTQELPGYRRFLERVLQESDEPFTVAEVSGSWRDMRAHYRRTAEQVLPEVADFFLQLDADQAAQMERKFQEENRKFLREARKGTAEERWRRRAKRSGEHLESWIGPLSEAQRELIESHYRGIPDLVEERLADRRYRQGELLGLIRAKPSRERLVEELRRLYVDTDSWRSPDFLRKQAARDERMFALLSALSTTLTAEQRSSLQRRLRNYMRDITTLTASN